MNQHIGHATVATKPKGPALVTSISEAVATPTESGALLRPDSWAGRTPCAAMPTGFGLGAVVRKAIGVASDTLRTPSPPDAFRNAAGGFETPEGASTMTTKTPTKGTKPTTSTTTQHIVTRERGLSFVTCTRTKRGAWVSNNHFDIDPTDRLADKKAAIELIQFIKRNQQRDHRELLMVIRDILIDAGATAKGGGPLCGEAMGFLNILADGLVFAMRTSTMEDVAKEQLADAEQFYKESDEREKAEIQARVARMVAAKRAKRLAAAGVTQ